MKIPLRIKCDKCGSDNYYFINLDDRELNSICSCGNDVSGFFDNNFTTGIKLLYRSKYEIIENNDYPLSIVFSASSVEVEISRLFFKWKNIENIRNPIKVTNEELEESLRRFRTISHKIENVAKLMHPNGLTKFVENHKELKDTIRQGFKSIDLKTLSESFRKEIFWPRNRILHLADSKYNYKDARKCFNISQLALKIFEELEQHRRNAI